MIRLTGKRQADYALKLVNECLDDDETWCVDFKKDKEAKTIQQLGALFGCWIKYLIDKTGNTREYFHSVFKCGLYPVYNDQGELDYYQNANYGGWLVDIYKRDCFNNNQSIWVNGCVLFEQAVRDNPDQQWQEAYEHHLAMISLKHANVAQTREYMNRIDQHYKDAGLPLPILDKFRKWYR